MPSAPLLLIQTKCPFVVRTRPVVGSQRRETGTRGHLRSARHGSSADSENASVAWACGDPKIWNAEEEAEEMDVVHSATLDPQLGTTDALGRESEP